MARKNVMNRAVVAEAEPQAAPAPSGLVKVRAVGYVHEDGVTRGPGDVFETTPERAAALGANVEAVKE